jgi:hypothetical protein
MAQRVGRESGRSGVSIATVTGNTGESQMICDWTADQWRNLQMEPFNWRWMRQTTVGQLVLNTYDHTPLSLGASGFERWVPETDDYKVTAYEASNTANEWKLTYTPYEQFRAQYLVGSPVSGPPQFWAIAPTGDFLVGPKPDLSTYFVRADYFIQPTELTVDGDVPAMPQQFHMLIVWRAVMQAAGFDAAPETYQRAQDNADLLHSQLVTNQGSQILINARPLGYSGRRK